MSVSRTKRTQNSAPQSVQFLGPLVETAEEREPITAACSSHFHVLVPSNSPASSAACFVTAEAASQESEVFLLWIRPGKPTCH